MFNSQHFNQTVYIQENLKLCFLHIPKTGSSSIKHTFKTREGVYNKEQLKDYKTVLIVRNPMTRIISSYTQVLKTHIQSHMAITRKAEFYKQRNNRAKSFELFLDFIKDNILYDPHVIPQIEFLKSKNLTLKDIDYVFDFDNYQIEIQKLMNIYNIKGNLKHVNKKRFNYDVSKYEQQIREIYPEDFKLYEKVKDN